MNGIDVAAYGWQRNGAMDPFYPDDLPAEWRLGYYGNEFAAVVVPAEQWSSVSAEEVTQWGREVDADFRFYWELPLGDTLLEARLVSFVAILRQQSGGVILRAPLPQNSAVAEAAKLLQSLGLPLGQWPTSENEAENLALRVARCAAEARAVRQQLQQLASCTGCTAAVLVCDGFDTLRQAKLVAQLSGVSRSA